MQCKLTGETGKAAKAHIIPESFYLIDQKDQQPLKLVSSDVAVPPKKSPIGIYDKTIVTASGEKYFLKWDDYAYKLLIENADKMKKIIHAVKKVPIAYRIDEYDYHKLKMFFISLLWRAGVSSRPEFQSVSLGPHADLLKEMILTNNSGGPDDYAVALAIFDDVSGWATIMSPFPERYDGVRCYRFFLGNIIAYIKVDKQSYKYPIVQSQLTPNQPLLLTKRNFWESKEHVVFKKMAERITF